MRRGDDGATMTAMRMNRAALRRGLLWVVAGLFAIGFAFWLEDARGMAPCALCLWERLPYRLLIAAGAVWIAFGAFGRAARWMWLVVAVILLAAVGLGVLHLGVEQHWWPSPLPECAAPRFQAAGSFAERLASMPARPAKPCDAANDLVRGMPVTVVDLALAYALGLLGILLVTFTGRARADAPARSG